MGRGVESGAFAGPVSSAKQIDAQALGSAQFRAGYGLKYAYVAGAMYKGIASEELVVALGKAGLMGYYGAGGVDLSALEAAIVRIKSSLRADQPFGMNLLSSINKPTLEHRTVDLYIKHHIRHVEAAAYTTITPGLVRYRLHGAARTDSGRIRIPNRLLAKISRPEVADVFLRPPPARIVAELVAAGLVSREQAAVAPYISLASEVCVEADSGGHTDQGNAHVLVPTMLSLRDAVSRECGYAEPVPMGSAGGIGTPHAAAAAFILGADFIMTGSINQCTVEAGASAHVKDLLQDINVQDTGYAPAGDMFELGAKVQVLRKGVLFPMRANKLYEVYTRYQSLDEIDDKTRTQLQEKILRRSFEEIWAEAKLYYASADSVNAEAIEANPKKKMAAVFKWYFGHSARLAIAGDLAHRTDFQVHCGPALGAFNQWVKGTILENWRNRRVADVGERIMLGAARVLSDRYSRYM